VRGLDAELGEVSRGGRRRKEEGLAVRAWVATDRASADRAASTDRASALEEEQLSVVGRTAAGQQVAEVEQPARGRAEAAAWRRQTGGGGSGERE
jgi:hypothetical protein